MHIQMERMKITSSRDAAIGKNRALERRLRVQRYMIPTSMVRSSQCAVAVAIHPQPAKRSMGWALRWIPQASAGYMEKQQTSIKTEPRTLRQGEPTAEAKKIRLQPRMMRAKESYMRTAAMSVPQ